MAWFFRVKYKNWAKAKKDYPAIFKDSGLIADKRNDYFKFYMLLASWWNMDYYLNYGNNINEESNNKCIAENLPWMHKPYQIKLKRFRMPGLRIWMAKFFQ